MKHFKILSFFLFLSMNLHASLMNIPDTFGLHPDEVGSARAFSLFSEGYSASYFNPAGLSQNKENQITLNYSYAKPQLKLNNEVAFSEPNEIGILGLKINLSNLISGSHTLSLGIILGVDKNFSGLLSIKDGITDSPQFIRYGRGQMLLITSLGVEPYRGVLIGGGAYIFVKSSASVFLETTLSGATKNESLELKGETGISPVIGLIFDPSRTFNSKKLDFIRIGMAYREKSEYTVRVKTNAVATIGGSPLTTLPLDLIFLDAFVPRQLSFGIELQPFVDIKALAFGFQANYLFWNDLDRIMRKKDAVRDELNIDFKNIFSPAIGFAYKNKNGFSFRAGYSYESSPLNSKSSGRANLVDSKRHIIGIGLGYTLSKFPGFRNPLSINAGYQLHLLGADTFTLEKEDGSTLDAETGGFLNALSVSLTMRF